jgi:hypothetical protein
LKFTCTLHAIALKVSQPFIKLRFAQSFSTSGSGVSAVLS